jgi:NADH:ubiquinone oxidoreductase subunit 6 (subunit J)
LEQSSVASLLFLLLVLVTVVSAVMVVLTLNIVRAAVWLLIALAGAAGLFFFLGADFVGATQLLIYVGGTLVLVIFGVMLTATGPFVSLAGRSGDWVLGILTGGALFGLLVYAVATADWREPAVLATNGQPTTNRVGIALLGIAEQPAGKLDPRLAAGRAPGPTTAGYLLPFEIISVHLVVVLIGAAYLARAKRRRVKETQ